MRVAIYSARPIVAPLFLHDGSFLFFSSNQHPEYISRSWMPLLHVYVVPHSVGYSLGRDGRCCCTDKVALATAGF